MWACWGTIIGVRQIAAEVKVLNQRFGESLLGERRYQAYQQKTIVTLEKGQLISLMKVTDSLLGEGLRDPIIIEQILLPRAS